MPKTRTSAAKNLIGNSQLIATLHARDEISSEGSAAITHLISYPPFEKKKT